jgi:hypothetical protein
VGVQPVEEIDMSSKGEITCGAHQVHALGDVDILSLGSGVTIRAAGELATLMMDGDGSAHLSSGAAVLAMDGSTDDAGKIDLASGTSGVIKIWSGMPMLGSLLKIEKDTITLSVGPPGVGSKIEMKADGITIQVAMTTFKMTATGITEELTPVKRELTPLGHKLTSAETVAAIDAIGVNMKAPMQQYKTDAVYQQQETLGKHATDAMRQQQVGIEMES